MEANTEVVYPSPGYSFCFQITRDRKLHFNWHHHTDYELSVCRSGSGEAYIGDGIYSFKNPAVFFISPMTNHALVSRDTFDGWIIQIPQIILDRYEGRPEFNFLKDLIRRAAPALGFSKKVSWEIVRILEKAQSQSGVHRWLRLLEVLYAASQDEAARICSFRRESSSREGEEKIHAIINDLFNNAADSQNLQETARAAHMSVQSFCRKFKKQTGMTFVEYIHSVRINNAKKLLQQSKMYADDISYECGFNSVSFFNRKFKEHTGMTPIEYRRRFGAG
jgi:AraC-like DNA-binding protein